ncbi:unnamed protein product, partial [marine sediment metagenome]
ELLDVHHAFGLYIDARSDMMLKRVLWLVTRIGTWLPLILAIVPSL